MKRPWCEDERRSVNTSSTVCSWKSRLYEGPRRGKGPEGTILEGCLSTIVNTIVNKKRRSASRMLLLYNHVQLFCLPSC